MWLLSLLVVAFGRRFPIPTHYSTDVPGYTEANFTTYADHYGALPDMFNMRYFTNDKYFSNSTGGPLLFYCGNEGAIEMFIENTGAMLEMAEEWGGLVVFAEHRYFGKSLPFGSLSYKEPYYLKYLSPHQALADYAYLITDLKTRYNTTSVLAVGGSYGGMLAGWFRMKYPYLIDAALAASAPLLHFQDIVVPEYYNEIISNDFKAQNQSCYDNIHQGLTELNVYLTNSSYWGKIEEVFNTCGKITSPDVAHLVYMWIYNAYEYMAMVDYPYPTGFLQPLPAWPVKAAWDAIKEQMVGNSTDWNRIIALRKAAEIYYNYDKKLTCNQINQEYDVTDSIGQAGWDYLACTTMIMPIGSTGVNDMFLDYPWNLTTWNENCWNRFHAQPQVDYAAIYYGADKDYSYTMRGYSNIFFSNGALDPWQSGAVTTNVSDTLVSIVIPDSAHHLDLRAKNPADPPSITWARKFERGYLKTWLDNANKARKEEKQDFPLNFLPQ